MAAQTELLSLVLVVMCLASVDCIRMIAHEEELGGSLNVKTATYLSPALTCRPGEVNNKYFLADLPKGHIGIRSVDTDLVDQNGVSLRLFDVYHHHSDMVDFVVPKQYASEMHLQQLLRHMSNQRHHQHGLHLGAAAVASFQALHPNDHKLHATEIISNRLVSSAAEGRGPVMTFPEPYVLESGKEMDGYETVRILNVHGLDTRGAVDPMGCTECRCNLYNVTMAKDGKPLPEGYLGGIMCCEDGGQCALKEGFNGEEITFHFKYVVEYVDWNDCLIPVTQVSADINDVQLDVFPEFTVEGCGDADPNSEECVDTRVATVIAPVGGEVVHVYSHLHIWALNASLWGEDGHLICESTPTYGQGHEAGDEKGYLVGVKACLGNAGTANVVKIKQGEKLKYIVHYSKVGGPHTGLMAVLRLAMTDDSALAAY